MLIKYVQQKALREIVDNKQRIKELSNTAETLDKMSQAQVEDGLKDLEMDLIRAKGYYFI